MRTETLEVDKRFGEEYAGRYVFQEISWAKRSRIIQKYTKYSQMTGQVVKSDYVAIQAETIWASLKEQPESKPISLEKLLSEEEGIPVELGELFSKVVNKLNGMANQDLRFLLEQLDEESRTQLLQSLGYVKRSGGRRNSSPNNQLKQSSSSL
jgi:hypothetical protein